MTGRRPESLVASQVWMMAAQAAHLAGGLLVTVLLARFAEAEGFGVFATMRTALALTATAVEAGLGAALVARLTTDAGSGECLLGKLRRFRLLAALVLAATIGPRLFRESTLLAAALGLAILSLPLRTGAARLAARRLWREQSLVPLLAQVLFVTAVCLRPGVETAAVALAAREGITSLWLGLAGARIAGARPPASDRRESLAPYGWLVAASVLGAFYLHLDVLAAREIGGFACAGRLGLGKAFVLPLIVAAGTLAAPLVPLLTRPGARPLRAAALIVGALAAPSALLAFDPQVIAIVRERGDAGAEAALAIQGFTPLAVALGSVGTLTLVARRRFGSLCFIAALTLILDAVLIALLVPRLDAVGAAWATLLSECFVGAASFVALRERDPRGLLGIALALLPVPAHAAYRCLLPIDSPGRLALAVGAAALLSAAFTFSPPARRIRAGLEGDRP